MEFETGQSAKYERVRIPDETYSAELKEIRDVKDGKFGPRVAFIFEIDIEGKKVELAKLCYKKKATQKNDIGNVLLVLGAKLDGSKVEVDKFIGSKVRVVVEDYTYKDESDGKDKIASTISKIKPLVVKV